MGGTRELRGRPGSLSWAALGVVYVAWGLTYLAIRVGVAHVPPLLLAGVRYLAAGLLLYPAAVRASVRSRAPDAPAGTAGRGRPGLGLQAWLAGAVVGILLLVVGNGGVSVAETSLSSGLAAVLVATVPLWMIIFARLISHEPVTAPSAAGLAIGLAGVAILVDSRGASGGLGGVVIVLFASASWGLGSVLSHRLALPANALVAAAIEMIAGGVVLLAAAAGAGEFGSVHWSAVPAGSWVALAYLIGPGSILAFSAYGYALSRLPVSTVSTYAYVNPVIAVLAGVLVLGEQLSWRESLGAVLVVGAVVIVMTGPRLRRRRAPDAAALCTPPEEEGDGDRAVPAARS
jgi:drug/metabolite transporter (DMT)-like permease